MRHYKKYMKKIEDLPVIRYLTYLLILTFIVTGVTFSRYSTSFSDSDDARTAKFSVTHEITDPNLEEQILLDPSIYATCKLVDAANCDFESIAVVRTLKITNASEVAVHVSLAIEDKFNMTENGIVWCILDKTPSKGQITNDITNKLGGNVGDFEDFDTLKDALIENNEETLSGWSTDLDIIGPNSSKTISIVFWAEHEPFRKLWGKNNKELATTQLDFKMTVTATQID